MVVGVLLVIWITTGGGLFTLKHLIVFILCSIPLCILYGFSVERFGSLLGGFLSGWSSKRFSVRETLAADLEIARANKRNGRFKEARVIIESILEKDPLFPEVLFLRAQILWEGFENSVEAKRSLRDVMRIVQRDEPLHRWASNLFDRIIESEKKEVK
jgi:hypothetical protein